MLQRYRLTLTPLFFQAMRSWKIYFGSTIKLEISIEIKFMSKYIFFESLTGLILPNDE
jgi:hypothetical protein